MIKVGRGTIHDNMSLDSSRNFQKNVLVASRPDQTSSRQPRVRKRHVISTGLSEGIAVANFVYGQKTEKNLVWASTVQPLQHAFAKICYGVYGAKSAWDSAKSDGYI